jgi:poly-beta-1,6-N-acetyl-D-glucosamine synthase
VNILLSQSTTYELVILSFFLFFFLIQLFYYLFVYLRVPIYRLKGKESSATNTLPPVSVVICARNEHDNLKEFLPSVLEQKYPNFEVIVVDDCSLDDTAILLRDLKLKYSHLKLTSIKPDDKFSHGKKLALTVGIKAATHDWVLLTDADCKPMSEDWIANMAENFTSTNEVVLGYGGYIPEDGFLNRLIRYDTFFIAIQYLGFALAGKPYMGVGRNLAYRKELFFKNKGFASHSFLRSGDDDLFVQQVANKRNTVVEFRPNAHTRSRAHKTFDDWVSQKRRHLTTSPFYRGGIKFSLTLEPLTRILFWALGILLLIQNYFPIIIGAILLFRLLLVNVILKIAMNRLNERKIFILSLLYDLFSPLFIGTFMLANRVTLKQNKWK